MKYDQSDEVFINERRWWLWLHVFHPTGQRCASPNIENIDHCWDVCATLGEMLKAWEFTEDAAQTLHSLIQLIWSLPSFNDVENRSFWSSETTDPELASPSFDALKLLQALSEIHRLRSNHEDPEWSTIYDSLLPEATFVERWIQLLNAHKTCSNIVEFRAVLGG